MGYGPRGGKKLDTTEVTEHSTYPACFLPTIHWSRVSGIGDVKKM